MREDVPTVTRLRRGEELLVAELQEPLFRRRPVVPSRRRPRRWRRFVLLLVKTGVLLAPPVALASWALTTPVFALASFQLEGMERVERSWVLARLEPWRGTNLLRLELDEVERGLASHPWIRGIRLRKDLPALLNVEIEEYRPAVLLETAESTLLAASDGYVIASVPPSPGTGSSDADPGLLSIDLRPATFVEPVVAGAPSSTVRAALEVVEEMTTAGEPWGRRLERLVVLGPDDYEALFDGTSWRTRIRRGHVQERWPLFERLLPSLEARFAEIEIVDLRFSRRIVLRPGSTSTTTTSAPTTVTGAPTE